MSQERHYTVRVHHEGAQGLWAEVVELPGCFASGDDLEELQEGLREALELYLSTSDHRVSVKPLTLEEAELEGTGVEDLRVLVSA